MTPVPKPLVRVFGLAVTAAIVALSTLFMLANPVNAETLEVSPTLIDVPASAPVQLSPVVLAILAGTIVPVLAGIVSRTTASSGAVAIVNLVVSALMVVVNYVLTNPVFDVSTVVTLFATTFTAGIASYYGVWKPINAGGDRAPLNGTLGIVGPKPGAA